MIYVSNKLTIAYWIVLLDEVLQSLNDLPKFEFTRLDKACDFSFDVFFHFLAELTDPAEDLHNKVHNLVCLLGNA